MGVSSRNEPCTNDNPTCFWTTCTSQPNLCYIYTIDRIECCAELPRAPINWNEWKLRRISPLPSGGRGCHFLGYSILRQNCPSLVFETLDGDLFHCLRSTTMYGRLYPPTTPPNLLSSSVVHLHMVTCLRASLIIQPRDEAEDTIDACTAWWEVYLF